MKRFLFLMMALMAFCLGIQAQTTDTGILFPFTDISAFVATFSGFVTGLVLLVEAIKKYFPTLKKVPLQLVSWGIGLVIILILWVFRIGFVADVTWYVAVMYGIGGTLVANGVADTKLIQSIIALFSKKKTQ